MTGEFETVEHLVRTRLAEALGGKRGVVESAVPTLAFTITFVATHDLKLALIASVAVTAVFLIVRVIQRSTVQFVLNALFAIGLGALFAYRSAHDGGDSNAQALAYFLPGIYYNAGYAAVFGLSVVVGWPVVGFMIGSITGDPTAWHQDKALVRLCSKLTLLLVAPCLVRLAVQVPLYLGDHVALLGTSKVVLGWPLQIAAFAAMAWLLSRDKTPATPTTAEVV